MISLAGDVAKGSPEIRHVFMFRNLDKNIISFMALMAGVQFTNQLLQLMLKS
jgi:hypothetical protein